MFVVLQKDDFVNADVWEWLLEATGLETHTVINGKVVDKEIEEINFTPVLCKGEEL
jgi:hypothetical protein|tara:strand:+ start:48 stop:215 length:168 start_codon:yes stop_codon:yes gene_type:complete